MGLSNEELAYLEKSLGRKANNVELSMVSAQWSEHCSYKSSKKYIKTLPKRGKYVLEGNYDTTMLDVGGGYVLTIHIESHNHPSAVEPYGGAATGVGGVVRDILSSGAKPIALLNALRFSDMRDAHAKWLFKNVVRGIADYGNCIGIPTVGGEVEFDTSFTGYCLVDVSCIGLCKRSELLKNRVDEGDYVILAGGSTGKDGIHGASFASKALISDDRSAVQIPDPFMEKLIIDATLEAIKHGYIKSMKDLGGGGLACALSETADKFDKGIDVMLDKVYLREEMSAEEIIISESQERMLYIIDKNSLEGFVSILKKYEIPYAIIGIIREHKSLKIYYDGIIADIPASLVANAPLINRKARAKVVINDALKPSEPENIKDIILQLLEDPSIASKRWIYEQYDHEVGLRTVIKPGLRDASILRLYEGKFLAVKLDGNSKHCYLDPYHGSQGCFSEACRNIVSVGAEPIGMIDHLQFGNPENEYTYQSFIDAINGIADYSRAMDIPCVGGKVSFYNESKHGEIKPSPVIGVIGLLDNVNRANIKDNDKIIITGITKDELGGSEYYEYIHNISAGNVPKVDIQLDKMLFPIIQKIVNSGLVNYVHDCSKGGLAIAISEMCILNDIGAEVDIKSIKNKCNRLDDILFSESHSRFVIAVSNNNLPKVKELLSSLPYSIIGRFYDKDTVSFDDINIGLDEARCAYDSIKRVMDHG